MDKQKEFLSKTRYEEAMSALKNNNMTTFSYIVTAKIFEDKNITSFHGLNSYEFAIAIDEKLFEKFTNKDHSQESDQDLKTAIDALYLIIESIINNPD